MIISFTIIILVLIGLCGLLGIWYQKSERTADKLREIAPQPLTLEAISEGLTAKGCTVENTDEENQALTFTLRDVRYHVDISRKPLVFLHTGWGIDEDTDKECLQKALDKTCENLVMIKGSMIEDGYTLFIASCEQTADNFLASINKYLEIIDDAGESLGHYYHEFIGEKRGREEAMEEIQGYSHAPEEADQRDNKLLS